MKLKKICGFLLVAFLVGNSVFAVEMPKLVPTNNKGKILVTSTKEGYPAKYTDDYLKIVRREYRNISKDENIQVALDMMKDTGAEFSREAIIGHNLSNKPIKVQFKDLATIDEKYGAFDALGWKKGSRLYIYINQSHYDAPPAAIAALLSHEALHQDEYNSLAEETYAWTMEAAVWCEMCELYPNETKVSHPLATRENTLKKLFIKGRYSDKYIKKSVFSNTGYQNLPQTSPGFEKF